MSNAEQSSSGSISIRDAQAWGEDMAHRQERNVESKARKARGRARRAKLEQERSRCIAQGAQLAQGALALMFAIEGSSSAAEALREARS